jgi:uncharacterized integral membrane protein
MALINENTAHGLIIIAAAVAGALLIFLRQAIKLNKKREVNEKHENTQRDL